MINTLSDEDYAGLNKFKSRTSLVNIKEMLLKIKKKKKKKKLN